MLDVESLASQLTPQQIVMLTAALEARAMVLTLDGELYAAHLEDTGWTVWKLEPCSTEYFLPRDLSSCTCPAQPKPCKHMLRLKFGPSSTQQHAPHRSTRQRRRRPLQRGEA